MGFLVQKLHKSLVLGKPLSINMQNDSKQIIFIRKYLKKHKNYFLVFGFIFLFPFYHFNQNKNAKLIIWYVGQGQMVTYSDITSCIHFDMGGEFFPVKKLVKECGRKNNKVFFSHWDWDHINFTKTAWRRLSSFCRLNTPGGKSNKRKKKFLSDIPFCKQSTMESETIFKEIKFPAHWNKTKKATDSNKYSRVVIVKNKILIPGDSPGSSEILWQKKIKTPIQFLVLSHHGSRYSTTPALLNHLPYLKIAIASARKKRYGHPHHLVKKRLAKKGVPLLSTEDFNHIHIPIN